jgi:hypothetical protein
MDSRAHIKYVRETLEESLREDETSPEHCRRMLERAHDHVLDYVANMGHADVNTAQRLAKMLIEARG